jgi:Glycosyltransferases involved in cell wall biogenesis
MCIPPRISIITAAYNSEKYIEQTIQSVLHQTYPDIEYIVVDGLSTDGTMDIVRKYRNRIDKVISEKDSGIYDAFNKGIKAATGDVIYFLNSDDYLCHPDVIGMVARIFADNGQDTMIVYGDIMQWNEYTGVIQRIRSRADLQLLQSGVMPSHPGLFIKKTLFEKYGYFDLNYSIASDFDFVVKVLKDNISHSVRIDEPIAVFRIGGASTQLLKMKQVRQETISIIERHFHESKLKPFTQEEYNSFFYKKWLEIVLYQKLPASTSLYNIGIRNVAVFGSLETAAYACQDLRSGGINVLAYLDNNPERHGLEFDGVPVTSPKWLSEHAQEIDAVLLAIGGDYDAEVIGQITSLTAPEPVRCISWREMIAWNFGES